VYNTIILPNPSSLAVARIQLATYVFSRSAIPAFIHHVTIYIVYFPITNYRLHIRIYMCIMWLPITIYIIHIYTHTHERIEFFCIEVRRVYCTKSGHIACELLSHKQVFRETRKVYSQQTYPDIARGYVGRAIYICSIRRQGHLYMYYTSHLIRHINIVSQFFNTSNIHGGSAAWLQIPDTHWYTHMVMRYLDMARSE
jgi:hypothetical protein